MIQLSYNSHKHDFRPFGADFSSLQIHLAMELQGNMNGCEVVIERSIVSIVRNLCIWQALVS